MDNTRKKYMVPDVKSITIDFEISLTIESNPDGYDNEIRMVHIIIIQNRMCSKIIWADGIG